MIFSLDECWCNCTWCQTLSINYKGIMSTIPPTPTKRKGIEKPKWTFWPIQCMIGFLFASSTFIQLSKKDMAAYSSIPAWEIPWTEQPGGIQSMGSKRVRRDLATKQQQKEDLPMKEKLMALRQNMSNRARLCRQQPMGHTQSPVCFCTAHEPGTFFYI